MSVAGLKLFIMRSVAWTNTQKITIVNGGCIIRDTARREMFDGHRIQSKFTHAICTKSALLCKKMLLDDEFYIGGHIIIVSQPVPLCLDKRFGFGTFLYIKQSESTFLTAAPMPVLPGLR
jgi:hypothetical protein